MLPDVARPAVTEDQVRAVKALAAGSPTDLQCRVFLEFFLHDICGVDRDCWATSDRDTAFLIGKRHPGLVLREMITLPVADLVKADKRKREKAAP